MSKRPRGRPKMPPSINLMIWVMVELTRDRQNPTRNRDSVSHASKKLATHLAECFPGARFTEKSALREYHKAFERSARKANSTEEIDLARGLLDIGRRRRELMGWTTSTWALVMDPEHLSTLGYTVLIHRN